MSEWTMTFMSTSLNFTHISFIGGRRMCPASPPLLPLLPISLQYPPSPSPIELKTTVLNPAHIHDALVCIPWPVSRSGRGRGCGQWVGWAWHGPETGPARGTSSRWTGTEPNGSLRGRKEVTGGRPSYECLV